MFQFRNEGKPEVLFRDFRLLTFRVFQFQIHVFKQRTQVIEYFLLRSLTLLIKSLSFKIQVILLLGFVWQRAKNTCNIFDKSI